MTIVGSVIFVVGLAVILAALVVLMRRIFRSVAAVDNASTPPYGGLPGLGPVGSLGELSPNADIGDPGASPDDLIGS